MKLKFDMRIWSYVVTLTGTLNWREVLPLSKILIYVINEEGLICLHARSYFVLVFKRQAASCQTPIVGLENCLFSRSVYQQCRCTPTFQQLSYWCRFFSLTRGQDRLGIKRKFQVRTEDISVMFLSSVCACLYDLLKEISLTYSVYFNDCCTHRGTSCLDLHLATLTLSISSDFWSQKVVSLFT